jgi:hypothetical protein
MAGLFDRPQQQPQQGLFGAIFSGMGRGLTNPGGFFVNEGAPAAQALGSMVLSPFVQANKAMPWGGNDPSAIGIDPQQGSIDPSVMVPWATDVAGTVTAGAGMAPAVSGGAGMGIRAYHGSPHDFDRFSMDKIGTGEGAQAYGHGLYFAEAEGVAKDYQRALGGKGLALREIVEKHFPGETFTQGDLGKIYSAAVNGHTDPLAAAKSVQTSTPHLRDTGEGASFMGPGGDNRKKIADAITQIRDINKGRMYEVDIDASPDEFLDWDKPLSEQPNVLPAMWEAGFEVPKTTDLSYLQEMAAKEGPDSWYAAQLHSLNSRLSQTPAQMAQALGDPSVVANLREKGIKGIRYKDAGSRQLTPEQIDVHIKALESDLATGGGDQQWMRDQIARLQNEREKPTTHNYVVFDDKTISILKKYGLAGLTAGGAGAAMLGGGTDQAQAAQPPWMTGGRF